MTVKTYADGYTAQPRKAHTEMTVETVNNARSWVLLHKRGLMTDGDLAIQLAKLFGLDIRCQLGECYHH